MKTEPTTFSIDDLENAPGQITPWEGVRNYQARNFLRDDVSVGDEILFYHSLANPPGIAGVAVVVKDGYPDHFAFNPGSKYYVPKSDPQNPVWYMVDVKLRFKLSEILPLAVLKETDGLEKMMVTQKGSRLSIQPVTADEWKIVNRLMKKYR